jgi:hypothetical protein
MRENLIDRMIALYGFESPIVIEFARLCENWIGPNSQLEMLVEAHEACPVYEED